jgi:hypothetical protein
MGLNSRSDRNLRQTEMGDGCNLSVTRRSPKINLAKWGDHAQVVRAQRANFQLGTGHSMVLVFTILRLVLANVSHSGFNQQ